MMWLCLIGLRPSPNLCSMNFCAGPLCSLSTKWNDISTLVKNKNKKPKIFAKPEIKNLSNKKIRKEKGKKNVWFDLTGLMELNLDNNDIIDCLKAERESQTICLCLWGASFQ